MRKNMLALVVAIGAAAGAATAHASCGSAFCSVNTNWGMQGTAAAGLRFDLRYEFIDQDQPRAGSHEIGVGAVPRHHDEVRTLNRNWNAALDYTVNPQWGLNLSLPLVDRDHLHIHNHRGGRLPEQWDFKDIGDARVLGRYQFSSEAFQQYSNGLQFGVKLPTGKTDVKNADGDEAERTLQPGSGTTDLLIGAYHHGEMPDGRTAWFAQALLQSPVNSHEDFRPGQQLLLDAGLRRAWTDRVSAMLQLNVQLKGRDKGAQAEPEDSGGTFVFLTPGISVAVARNVQLYGFVQLPLHQYVNGVQLTADRTFVLGASTHF